MHDRAVRRMCRQPRVLLASLLLLLSLTAVSAQQPVQLLVGPPSSPLSFTSAFYSGLPAMVVPPTAAFSNNSALITSVAMQLSPPADPAIEGLSFSTAGLNACW